MQPIEIVMDMSALATCQTGSACLHNHYDASFEFPIPNDEGLACIKSGLNCITVS